MPMKIHYNAPVVLSFTLISTVVMGINSFTGGMLLPLFSIDPVMNLLNPIDYLQMFSHVVGHGGWEHLVGNFTFILLLGPILEEKYGSASLLKMILVTAVITGVLNVSLFHISLLGASGIVFMMILLASIVNVRVGEVPLTFVLVVILFLGKELANSFQNDNISQFAHILGGICGAFFGFYQVKGKRKGGAKGPIY